MPESSERVPDYRRVVEYIRAKIRSGEYPPGHQIPSKNQLVEQLGVKGGSVDTAMAVLDDSGWIRGEQGRARYVADNPPIG